MKFVESSIMPLLLPLFVWLPLTIIVGCDRQRPDPVTPADEELYSLVGEPCAEGDYNTAIARADSLLAGVEMSDSVRAYIMLDRNVSILNMGWLGWGGAYADTVIAFGKSSGVEIAVTQGLQNRGISKRKHGDYDGAISDYSQAFDIAVASGDKEMEQALSESLAIVLGERRRNEEALHFCRRALSLALEAGDSVAALNAVSSVGAVLVSLERYVEALDELRPYRHMATEAVPSLRVKFLTPVVNAYLAMDSVEKAGRFVAMADSAALQLPHGHQADMVVTGLKADVAGRQGRYADQWQLLQRMDSCGSMGRMPWAVFNSKAKCLARLGRYEEAYGWQQKAFESRDSISHADTDARLAEISVKYATLQKEIEIEQLRAQRLFWIVIALLAVIVLAAVVMAGLARRRRVRLCMERERQEEYLRGIEQERQRMARELHDDIAGELVGMQWMMQSLSREDVSSRIAEIGMRVRELSHELMPPQFVSQTFTQLLIDFVARFNNSHTGFHISLTDEGSFPWDSISPEQNHELYRIVQEAVNNAVKHGMPGEIQVTLSGSDRFCLSITNAVATDGDDGYHAVPNSLKVRASILNAHLECHLHDQKYVLEIIGAQSVLSTPLHKK